MTRTSIIDQATDTGLANFYGSSCVSRSRVSFPREGAPVMIEPNGRGVQITVGSRNRLILNGSLDARTGHLTGDYNENQVFELSLSAKDPSFERSDKRHLCCGIHGGEDVCPASSSWDADEDGPG